MSRNVGIASRLKRNKITEVVASGKRMDGRDLLDYREIQIKTGVLEKVEGSAEAYLGKTRVLVGVKFGKGYPFDDTPDKGVLMTNAEFTPIAHATFEPGPPDERSTELARVVDRGLRSAEILDMKKLCLVKGKAVYMVHVDIYVLSYDGNLIDCSAMAAIAAMKTAKMPVYTVKDGNVKLTKKTKAVKIRKEPLAVSIVKIGDSLLVDPSADEEEVMDARITVTLDEKGNVCTIQKAGSVGFTRDELKTAVEIAAEKVEELRKNV